MDEIDDLHLRGVDLRHRAGRIAIVVCDPNESVENCNSDRATATGIDSPDNAVGDRIYPRHAHSPVASDPDGIGRHCKYRGRIIGNDLGDHPRTLASAQRLCSGSPDAAWMSFSLR
jgi:hypothetical protein